MNDKKQKDQNKDKQRPQVNRRDDTSRPVVDKKRIEKDEDEKQHLTHQDRKRPEAGQDTSRQQ